MDSNKSQDQLNHNSKQGQPLYGNSNGVWTKEKIKQFGCEIEGKLKECTFDERVQWITDKKEQANGLFKE